MGHRKGIIVGIAGHTHHQVYTGGGQHLSGFFGGAYLCESRRIAQTQVGIFVENLFVNSSVVFQHEGIVGVGHYQDIENTVGHQIDERHVFQVKFFPL